MEWKRKMAAMLALVLCFSMVACSSEESGSSSSSDDKAESSQSEAETAKTEEEEPEEEVEEEADTAETEEVAEEATGEEAGATETAGTLQSAGTGNYSAETVAEYEVYAAEVMDYMGLCVYSIMAMELLAGHAGEDPDQMMEVAVMMDELTLLVHDFQTLAVPEDLKWQHKALADSLDGIMGGVTDMVYVLTDVMYMVDGIEGKSESELLAMVSELEELEIEIEKMDVTLNEKIETMMEVADEMDLVLGDVLGAEYLAQLSDEMEAAVETEYAALVEILGS